MIAAARPLAPGDRLHVRVVTLAELAHTEDGLTRGYAHVGTGDLPVGAPGRLDFAPLLLCATGTNLPGEAFPMHRHEHIENVMVMSEGRFEHRDSLGNRCEVGADGVCVLSAGAGVEHAERVVGDDPVRALLLWLRPRHRGRPPAYHHASPPRTRDRWTVLASGRPSARGALPLDCDADILRAEVASGTSVVHELHERRRTYAIALGGEIEVAGRIVRDGERVLATGTGRLELVARTAVEVVLVDMAG